MDATSRDLYEGIGLDNFTTEENLNMSLPEEENTFFWPTPEDMLNPSQRNPAFYPIVITHAITFVLGIFGNIVAVSVMVGDRKGRSATNMFLVSLAVADLLLLLLCIPLEVLLYFLQFEDNGVICKTARYTELLSATASVLNLCAVSLERFIVIVFPMRSRSVCTMSNCRKAVCFVWVVAMIISLPVMLTEEGYSVRYTNYVISVDVYYCEEKSVSEGLPIAIYKFVILFAAPAILMMICYFYVIRELWRSTRTINILTNSKSAASKKSELGSCAQTSTASVITRLRNRMRLRKSKEEEGKAKAELQNNLLQTPRDRSPSVCSMRSNGDCIFSQEESSSQINNQQGNGQELNVKYLQATPLHPNRNGRPTPQKKAEDPKKTRKQVIQMLILIILLFLVCWGPKLILSITLKLALIFGIPIFRPEVYYCRVIFSLIPFVHSCINPIVYSFMSSQFRKKMSRQLGLCCVACGCKCVKIDPPPGTRNNRFPPRPTPRQGTTTLAIESHQKRVNPELSVKQTEIEEVSTI